MSVWALLAMLETASVPTKDAAPACRVSLASEGAEPQGIDLDSLRLAIGHETRCVVSETPLEGVPHLVLRLDVPTRARLELSHPDGRRLERDVPLDLDVAERVHAIAIVATHMLRNEADELLAALTAQRESVAAGAGEENLEVGVAVDAGSGADAAIAPAAHDRAADAQVTADPEIAPPSPPLIRLAIGASLSSTPARGGLDATFVGGLEVAVMATPWLAIGLRDLGGSGLLAPRDTWALGGAPFAELAWRFDDTWSIHGQVGADVRVLGGSGPERAGVAPFVLAGGRVQLLREVSLALQTGLHVAASETWATALHGLPQGAILWSGGLSLALHL